MVDRLHISKTTRRKGTIKAMSDVLLAFGAFLREQVYAPQTIQGYLEELRKYARWLQSEGMTAEEIILSQEALWRYFQALEETGVSARGKSRANSALRAFERFQSDAHLAVGVSGEDKRTGNSPEPTKNATQKNMRALIKEFHRQKGTDRTVRQTWLATRNQAILQVLQETHLRASKVCELQVVSDVRRDNLEILHEIFPGIELSTNASQALVDWLKLRKPGQGLLFMRYSGEPMQPFDIYCFKWDMRQQAKMYGTSERP